MRRTLSIAAMVSLLACGAAIAQEDPQRGRARAARAGDALSPVTVAEMLDAYALVQAQTALQLNDAQYGQFVTRLKRLQDTRRRNQQARNRIIVELRKLAGPQAPETADEAAIRERIRALREQDVRSHDEMLRALDALDEGLDARQQARFRLFEEQIERRKFDLLMRARQRAARGGGL
jgi:hypothetical protein